MEIELEIVTYGTEQYLRVRVETETECGSTILSLKELKQALENV